MTKLISTALFSKSFSQDSKNQVKITEKKREKNYPSQEDFMSELFLCLPITANAVLVMEFMAKILRRFGSIEVTLEEIQNATKLKTKTATKTTLKKLMAEGFLTTTNKFEKNSHKKAFSYKFTDLIQCFFDASKVRKKLAYVEKKQRRIKKQYKLDKLVKIQKNNQELLDGYLHYYNRLKLSLIHI